jgi:hypothetical protein
VQHYAVSRYRHKQHVIHRCRAVAKLGPGRLQSWAEEVKTVLREAHDAVEAAKEAEQAAVEADLLAKLRARYDKAVAFGLAHNRHRPWVKGNHPGYTQGTRRSSSDDAPLSDQSNPRLNDCTLQAELTGPLR